MIGSERTSTSIASLLGLVALGYVAGHWKNDLPVSPRFKPNKEASTLDVGERDPGADRSQLHESLEELDDGEFPALLAHLQNLPTARAELALGLVMRQWAKRDGPAALAYFLSVEPTRFHDLLGSSLFAAWAETDGETALLEATRITQGGGKDWRVTVLESYARSEPIRAWHHARIHFGDEIHGAIVGSVFSHWVRADPEASLAMIEGWREGSEGHPSSLTLAQTTYLDTILPIDPDLAMRLSESFGQKVPGGSWQQWLREDSVAAIAFIRRTPDDHDAKRPMLEAWIKADPVGAVDYIRGLRKGSTLRRSLSFTLAQAQEHLNDEEILAAGIYGSQIPLARLLGVAERRPELLEIADSSLVGGIAAAWAEEDPQGGLGWLNGLPDATRREARRSFMVAWADADLAAATEHLLETDPSREHYEVLVAMDDYQPTRSWEDDDPHLSTLVPAVGRWLVSLSLEQRAAVLKEDDYSVAERMPDLAKTWALELPPGEERRDAVLHVMHTLEMEQSGAIQEWFPELPPELRQAAFDPREGEENDLGSSERSLIEQSHHLSGLAPFELALQLPESDTRIGAMLGAFEQIDPFGEVERLGLAERLRLAELLQDSNISAEEKALVQERIDGVP